MAIAFVYVGAVALGPTTLRLLSSGQPSLAQHLGFVGRDLWVRISDPNEATGDLESALSQATGRVWSVADYSGTFELRKAQVRWGRISGAAAGTDDAVTTHHFIKLVSGAPNATWVEADFTGAEAALLAFWNGIKDNYQDAYVYKQVRWYRVGPGIALSGAPVRVIDPNVSGTQSNASMPPQVAVSVTERTSDAKSWGRFYLPPPSIVGSITNGSRLSALFQADVADNADTMYESFVTNNTPAVVYSAATATRPTARALGVGMVQVDDLFDVIRSRRWNEPLLRLQRAIAGS